MGRISARVSDWNVDPSASLAFALLLLNLGGDSLSRRLCHRQPLTSPVAPPSAVTLQSRSASFSSLSLSLSASNSAGKARVQAPATTSPAIAAVTTTTPLRLALSLSPGLRFHGFLGLSVRESWAEKG